MHASGNRSKVQFIVALLIIFSAGAANAHAQTGACCLNDMGAPTCMETTEVDCNDAGGCWMGEASACATTICQVAEWSMQLDQGSNTLQLQKFNNKQNSHLLERLAARIDVGTTQSIALEVLPERRTCLDARQTRVDVRITVNANAPGLNLFPLMLPLDIDSGFPWLPGTSQPRYCGDPKDPAPVICPPALSPPGPTCDYGGEFEYAGSDSFLLIDDHQQFGDFSHDGSDSFNVVVSGNSYFVPYASFTIFTNPVNHAEGVLILGYGFRVVNGACCLSDGSCSFTTLPECGVAGGIYQGDDVICETQSLCQGACCLSNMPCQLVTRDECDALFGVFLGAGTNCDFPNGCSGACCLRGGSCIVTTQEECAQQCGQFLGENEPCPFICAIINDDACCLPDGSCQQLCPVDCAGMGGQPMGLLTQCDEVVCPKPTGACCAAEGTCSESNEAACAKTGGIYQGHGSRCETIICPQPATGACCHSDGSCSLSTAAACAAAQGVYQGDNTACDTGACPAVGGCCMTDQTCTLLTESNCLAAGGNYQGDLTTCEQRACPDPCVSDLNQTGVVDVIDLFAVLSAWGPCQKPCVASCHGDITNAASDGTDCIVDVFDLLKLLSEWGVCD